MGQILIKPEQRAEARDQIKKIIERHYLLCTSHAINDDKDILALQIKNNEEASKLEFGYGFFKDKFLKSVKNGISKMSAAKNVVEDMANTVVERRLAASKIRLSDLGIKIKERLDNLGDCNVCQDSIPCSTNISNGSIEVEPWFIDELIEKINVKESLKAS